MSLHHYRNRAYHYVLTLAKFPLSAGVDSEPVRVWRDLPAGAKNIGIHPLDSPLHPRVAVFRGFEGAPHFILSPAGAGDNHIPPPSGISRVSPQQQVRLHERIANVSAPSDMRKQRQQVHATDSFQ